MDCGGAGARWSACGAEPRHLVPGRPPDFRTDGVHAGVGAGGRVREPKEYRHLFPGFYVANGDAPEATDDAPTVRVYWNVRVDGAVELIAGLTRGLNGRGIPFQLKAPDDPRGFDRADAVVVYLPKEAYQAAAPLIDGLHRGIRPYLRPWVSAYAKHLAPGLGVAEDPPGDLSFGEQRSRLLATALAGPDVALAASVENRLQAVTSALRAAGYKPEAFHLNPGSPDTYEAFERSAT